MEIENASVIPTIHIARALGVLPIEASLATSLVCSLRWSTSCLTYADELAASPICVAFASCCNSGMLGGLCARQSHHIAHPRYNVGKIKMRTSVTCFHFPEPAYERVVFQDWSFCVITSHLSYTFDQGCHCEAIVKVHGVLPSSRWYSASSRRIQFHQVHVGDSGAVVTPFVQVATYATRNFATLEQLELLPPFIGASIQSL
ncbi:hypothetical protein RYX36_021471 [Vicia faba]